MHTVALALAVAVVVPSSSSFLGKLPLPTPNRTLSSNSTPEGRAAAQARAYFASHATDATLHTDQVQFTDKGYVVHQVQTIGGIPIDGTYATALIRNDNLIYANETLVPRPSVATKPKIEAQEAINSARQHMSTTAQVIDAVGLPQLLVVFVHTQPVLVWRVPVSSSEPAASWNADIDAQTGELAQITKSSMELGTGIVRAPIEPICQGDKTVSTPLPFVRWNTGSYADPNGEFTIPAGIKTAKVMLESPYLSLYDEGKNKTPGPWKVRLAPSPAHNEIDLDTANLTHTDAYYSFHTIRQWVEDNAAQKSAQASWVKESMTMNVNLPRHCNAYYSPFFDTLNFFSAGEGCIDTARSPIVIFHEYGHALMHHSGNNQQHTTALHEGYADVIAAYVSGQPKIRDINPRCTDTLRTCENTYTYCKNGCDYSNYDEGHDSAQVVCGAWWELREHLQDRYGKAKGVDLATKLFLTHLELIGRDMPDTYSAAIAADDDDDGDPSNGTTHSCEINAAYANPEPGATVHFPELKGLVPCAQ